MLNKLTAARLVPRAIAGTTISAYEAATRSITDLEWIAAGRRRPSRSASWPPRRRTSPVSHHDSTKDGVLEFLRISRTPFNLRMQPEDVLASGDKVVARVRATGTHDGELIGMPATGKSVDAQLIDIMRFDEDGLVTEHWGVVDMLAMMQQLGVADVSTPA